MRRQVSTLVALISTAIVASFVIPLLLLVSSLAADRGMAVAGQQANSVAMLVAGLNRDVRLPELLSPALASSPAATSVVLADGTVLGVAWPDFGTDPGYRRARGGEAFSTRDDQGGHVFVPVLVDGGVAVIRSSVTPDQLNQGVPLAWTSIIALGLLLSGVAVFVADRAARAVSRPLQDVAATAHRLREGDLAARAPMAGPPETVELGSALNGLAERVGEVLEAERDSVRGLAHRLRTPVTALRLQAEQLADDDLAQLVSQLQVAIDRVLTEARRPLREDLPVGCDAREVTATRIEYWRPLAEDQNRTLAVTLPDGPAPVALSALDLADVIDICIDNVFAHTPEGTGFAVSLEVVNGRLRLAVTDQGPGFAAAASGPRPGTSGLGLQLARRTIERAGGTVAMSAPGRSPAEVLIELPVAG